MSKLLLILNFKIKNEMNLVAKQIILNILNKLLLFTFFIDKNMKFKNFYLMKIIKLKNNINKYFKK